MGCLKQKLKLLIWKIKILIYKIKYPKAGYYEQLCLAAGFSKEDIDSWVEKAIEEGWIENGDKINREEVCSQEVSCWD